MQQPLTSNYTIAQPNIKQSVLKDIYQEKPVKKNRKQQQNLLTILNQLKNLQVSKTIIATIFIIVVVFFLLIQINPAQPDKYLKIPNNHGKLVDLPHFNNEILIPPNRKQEPLVQLNIKNITLVQQISKAYPQKIEFSKLLFSNWADNNETIFQTQYYRLNLTYNLDLNIPQKRMCIMAPYRNLLKYGYDGTFHSFLKSLNAQNYSNYMVYMMDDFSTDQSAPVILKQLEKYSRLSNRLRIIKNKQILGALGNRDSATRNYCRSGDIVIDIDGDDALIGKQVFNLYNHIYHNNTNAWFVYANFLAAKGSNSGDGRGTIVDMSTVSKGPCKPIPQFLRNSNSYRTNIKYWVTSQLRSYLRDLYIRIPLEYILQKKTGAYYEKASDRFVMYALSQLAGPQHTFFFQQYLYFYYRPNFSALSKLKCSGNLQIMFYQQAKSRMLTPMKQLKNLTAPVEITQFYVIPSRIIEYYIQKKYEWLVCQEEENGVSDIFAKHVQ